MNYWIFKVSSQSPYPDTPGRQYLYDNTHSARVRGGDEFLYLEKARTKYGLTGAGRVSKVTGKKVRQDEQRSARVRWVHTAHLVDVVWFSKPFDLSPQTKGGRRNRVAVGLPKDLNRIGWSISMPRIERDFFVCLLDAALQGGTLNHQQSGYTEDPNWRIDDSWSLVRRRHQLQKFRETVLKRHNHTCAVCGTRMKSVIEVAHVRSYAASPEDRANPANGICLCSFCHTAFDSGELLIFSNGSLRYASDLSDEIGLMHFTSVSPDKRRAWLCGVDDQFLKERAGINE